MVNKELKDYISSELQAGVGKDLIRKNLLASGWQEADVEGAFRTLSATTLPNKVYNPGVDSVRSYTTVSKNRKGYLKVLVLILLLLVISGGTGYAYFFHFIPPAKVAAKMFAGLNEIKSFTYHTTLKVEALTNWSASSQNLIPIADSLGSDSTTTDQTPIKFQIDISGGVDSLNPEDARSKTDISLSADSIGGVGLKVGFQSIIVSKKIFLKLSSFPDLGFFDLSQIKDKWVKVDLDEALNRYGQDYGAASDSLAQAESLQLEKILDKHQLIKLTQKLASEKISNQPTFHYQFAFDQEELKAVLLELNQQEGSDPIISSREIDSFFSETPLPVGEIWIGKIDYRPYQLILTSNLADYKPENSSTNLSGSVKLTTTFDQFNQPLEIAAPEEQSLEFNEALELIQGLSKTDKSSLEGKDPDKDSDGLSDGQEAIYGTDPGTRDSDSDSYSDGEEVKNGFNPLGSGLLKEISEPNDVNNTLVEPDKI